jgi:hypothetical protein
MFKPGRIAAVAATVMLLFVGAVYAKTAVKAHHHNDGHKKAQAALKAGDGRHDLEKNGKHKVSVDVKGGKISGFHATHESGKDKDVRKVKSKKKLHASIDAGPSETQPADALPADTDMGVVWVGYAYVDDEGNEEYYWFQADEIIDGETGAVEYVPIS